MKAHGFVISTSLGESGIARARAVWKKVSVSLNTGFHETTLWVWKLKSEPEECGYRAQKSFGCGGERGRVRLGE